MLRSHRLVGALNFLVVGVTRSALVRALEGLLLELVAAATALQISVKGVLNVGQLVAWCAETIKKIHVNKSH